MNANTCLDLTLTQSTTSEAISSINNESQTTPATNINHVTIQAPSFVRLFLINRIMNHECTNSVTNDDQNVKTTMIKKLVSIIPNDNIMRSVAFDIISQLIDNGIKQYMIEFYNQDEHANIIEIIFNQIILTKFAKEYANQVNFAGINNNNKSNDYYYQNAVFNSNDLVSCIFQYLTYEMNFDGDLSKCELVNSKWLYHVWNPQSIYFIDITKLFCLTASYNYDNINTIDSNTSFLRQWQRLMNVKHVRLEGFDHDRNCPQSFAAIKLNDASKNKLMFEKITSTLVNVQKLTLKCWYKYNRNVMLFWQLLGQTIKKNNGKVTLIKYKMPRLEFTSEEKYLNQMIEKHNLKIDTMHHIHNFSKKLEKLLKSEFEDLKTDPIDGVQMSIIGEDVRKWRAHINGPIGSSYQGRIFVVDLTFSAHYPVHPPSLTMETPIAHPNIRLIYSKRKEKFEVHHLNTAKYWTANQIQARNYLNEIVKILNNPVSQNEKVN